MARMETLPEARGKRLGNEPDRGAAGPRPVGLGEVVQEHPASARRERAGELARRAAARLARSPAGMALAVYLASRLLYLMIALLDLLRSWPLRIPSAELLSPGLVPTVQLLAHSELGRELSNWDGVWYIDAALHGYPHAVEHWQSTLGFMPLYPALIWLVSHALFTSALVAGLLISLAGGAIATVLVERLARGWWGAAASRRAVLFFCFFPGSIVFSMVYSEGLTVPLVAGCLLALARRRWLAAGLLAGAATAVEPVALAVIPACAAAAWQELRRRGLTDRSAWRSLLAPVLSPLGVIGFGLFLWAWTGTPLASYDTQRYAPGWAERSSALTIFSDVQHMVHELFDFGNPIYPRNINLNYENGVFGAAFMLVGLWLIWRLQRRIAARRAVLAARRGGAALASDNGAAPAAGTGAAPAAGNGAALTRARGITLPAVVWTLAVAALTLTSANTPPNPRMLLLAFPPVIAVAAAASRRRTFRWLMGTELALTIVCSALVFVNVTLRP
jgi:hypothetical protein